jgi:RNA polymerase sigma-70 factor (ECF subfamily)
VFYYTLEKLASVSPSQDPRDEDLVRQTLDGQPSAYAELARRWAAPVLAVCHARVRCWHSAEDLAQETLLRGLRALPTLTAGDRFGPWLRGIAQRVCLDWLKAKQTAQVPFTSLAASEPPEELLATAADAASREVEGAEESRRLLDCVNQLDDDCREVLLLYYYQDVTYADLAELLGVSPATINARLTKARAALRQRLRHVEARCEGRNAESVAGG